MEGNDKNPNTLRKSNTYEIGFDIVLPDCPKKEEKGFKPFRKIPHTGDKASLDRKICQK